MSRTSSSVCGANCIETQFSGRAETPLSRLGLVQAVLRDQGQIVALVEDLAADVGVQLAEPAHLPVLLRHQPLIERGDLDEQVVGLEVEVRGEPLDHVALGVPLEVERPRLVLPIDLVEVEQPGELSLTGVSEGNEVAGEGFGSGAFAGQAPPALVMALGARGVAAWRPLPVASCFVSPTEPERSSHTASSAMAKTPCPRRTRSMTSSSD